MSDLRARLEGLSDRDRRALLARISPTPSAPPAPRAGLADRKGSVSLSSAQERMWFLEQFHPDSAMHVMAGATKMPVTVPADVFRECLLEVIERHEALRTRFRISSGSPIVEVSESADVDIQIYKDITSEEMWKRFEEAAQKPFRIGSEPLIRAILAYPADGSCYVLITLHHLVADGYSTGIFFQELATLCTGRLMGSRLPLGPVPYHYADFVRWQELTADSTAMQGSVDYWREHLAEAPRLLSLPEDHPRPSTMSYRGSRRDFRLEADDLRRLRSFSTGNGVTPFVAILTAYAITLTRWAAQDGVVIGVPVAQRDAPGSDRVIGPFLNTIALHLDLTGDPTVAELLEQANHVTRTGFQHQSVPLDAILSSLRVPRDPARSPLFQAVLNVQEDRSARDMEFRDLHNGSSHFDLLLNLVLTDNSVIGNVDYASDVFHERTVDALIDTFITVLNALIDHLNDPVIMLPVGSTKPDLTVRPLPQQQHETLHGAILDVARCHPSRIALTGDAGAITYAELDRRSAAIATHIQGLTVPGDLVGILMKRGQDTVLALLGVLRSGCSFVPLDPEYPPHRLAQICDDASLAAILTTGEHTSDAPQTCAPLIELADIPPTEQRPNELVGSESCAYQIYTSGSTGRPKGVRVSHRNVVAFCVAMAQEPGLGRDDVLLAVTSPSFDISILEMLLPLTLGAQVVSASSEQATDPTALARLIDDHSVTVMQATPATWELLLYSGWTGSPELRALCGGEAMPLALAVGLVPLVGQLWNMYGPTETTIWSSVHEVTEVDLRRGSIPLGRPIHGSGLLIADLCQRPVPDGMYGELLITGSGVSLGYYMRDELNAERFVTLHSSDEQIRAYRTGDLVRRRRDGRIEFAGRIDLQVKVRGFRIELGDVESAIEESFNDLRAIASLNADDESLEVRLRTAADTSGPETSTVRQRLTELLPGYMVPSRVGYVDEFPLTPNGKIDRKAVAAIDLEIADDSSDPDHNVGTAPRTDLERQLAEIWLDLLDLPQAPGINEDFFAIGGHSLLATKLVFRIRDVLGEEIPLPILFRGELTIARLAEVLNSDASALAEVGEVDLTAEAVLDESIHPGVGAHVHTGRHPQHLLLTGGTGFLGSFLIEQLMRDTRANLFCLVRAATSAEALDRIRQSMLSYGIWREEFADRIIVVLGTLDRPRLGLSTPEWHHLANIVDGIVHSGAEVNFLRSYESLKPANVLGTQEVLRLAAHGSVKPVHFMSTTYVFSRFSYPPDTVFLEQGMEPIHDLEYTFGYTQSKWVAEQLALAARDRGMPIYVYRTGRVAGHSQTGACQLYDFVWQVIRLGIHMGQVPVMDMAVDMTPVDYVVESISHISRKPEASGRIFHVVSPDPLDEPELVEWMESYGYVGERMSFARWCAHAVEQAGALGDDAATSLAPFLSGTLPLDRIPRARFDDSQVQGELADSDIRCHPIDHTLLRRYFDWFVAEGFLPAPARPEEGTTAAASKAPAVLEQTTRSTP
ncbi:MAG: non-ribosomal peptide synthetase [Nesterenkonia sp.]